MGRIKRFFAFHFFSRKQSNPKRKEKERRKHTSASSVLTPAQLQKKNTALEESRDADGMMRRNTSLPHRNPESARLRNSFELVLKSSSQLFKIREESARKEDFPIALLANAVKRKPTPIITNMPSNENDGSYVVTIHRKKLHARTELSPTESQIHQSSPCMSAATSSPSLANTSFSSYSDHNTTPTPQRTRRSSTGNLRLRKQSSVLNILKLYDKDGVVPLEAFSNTPRSSEFVIAPPKFFALDGDKSGAAIFPQTVMEEQEMHMGSPVMTDASKHDSQTDILSSPIAPLNVPSASRPPLSSTISPAASTQHLRLSSPLLFDFLFSPDSISFPPLSRPLSPLHSGSFSGSENEKENRPPSIMHVDTKPIQSRHLASSHTLSSFSSNLSSSLISTSVDSPTKRLDAIQSREKTVETAYISNWSTSEPALQSPTASLSPSSTIGPVTPGPNHALSTLGAANSSAVRPLSHIGSSTRLRWDVTLTGINSAQDDNLLESGAYDRDAGPSPRRRLVTSYPLSSGVRHRESGDKASGIGDDGDGYLKKVDGKLGGYRRTNLKDVGDPFIVGLDDDDRGLGLGLGIRTGATGFEAGITSTDGNRSPLKELSIFNTSLDDENEHEDSVSSYDGSPPPHPHMMKPMHTTASTWMSVSPSDSPSFANPVSVSSSPSSIRPHTRASKIPRLRNIHASPAQSTHKKLVARENMHIQIRPPTPPSADLARPQTPERAVILSSREGVRTATTRPVPRVISRVWRSRSSKISVGDSMSFGWGSRE